MFVGRKEFEVRKIDRNERISDNALSHLGPNVGKPVRRYGFASLLIVATQLTFFRPRYYEEIQRCGLLLSLFVRLRS